MTPAYTYFVFLRATPAWLRLSRSERDRLAQQHLTPLLGEPEHLRMRFFDAEAFSAFCSDVMMIETDDPMRHYFFMEGLRDTPLIHTPYFEVLQIVPALEDGFRAYEKLMDPQTDVSQPR